MSSSTTISFKNQIWLAQLSIWFIDQINGLINNLPIIQRIIPDYSMKWFHLPLYILASFGGLCALALTFYFWSLTHCLTPWSYFFPWPLHRPERWNCPLDTTLPLAMQLFTALVHSRTFKEKSWVRERGYCTALSSQRLNLCLKDLSIFFPPRILTGLVLSSSLSACSSLSLHFPQCPRKFYIISII